MSSTAGGGGGGAATGLAAGAGFFRCAEAAGFELLAGFFAAGLAAGSAAGARTARHAARAAAKTPNHQEARAGEASMVAILRGTAPVLAIPAQKRVSTVNLIVRGSTGWKWRSSTGCNSEGSLLS